MTAAVRISMIRPRRIGIAKAIFKPKLRARVLPRARRGIKGVRRFVSRRRHYNRGRKKAEPHIDKRVF